MNPLARAIMGRAGAGAPALTLPTANLLAAWDARLGVTNVSGACSAWADQSGNGKHLTQGAGAARPAITTVDGYAALNFNGVNNYMVPTSLTAATGVKTIYAVIKPTSDATRRALIDIQTGRILLGTNLSKYAGHDGADRDTGVAISTSRQRVTYQVQSGNFAFWLNGTPATTTAWAAGATAIGAGVAVGAQYAASAFFFSGHILFLAIYTAARNTAVEAYITQEWGV